MAEIIKTWPLCVSAKTTAEIFNEKVPPFAIFYFALGRGKPKQDISRIWFTYDGRIIGSFEVEKIICNDSPDAIPRLSRLDGGESEWQIRKDAWVAICRPPCTRVKARVYMDGFRGWRYFNFQEYSQSGEARIRL